MGMATASSPEVPAAGAVTVRTVAGPGCRRARRLAIFLISLSPYVYRIKYETSSRYVHRKIKMKSIKVKIE
jgi:hypothetical protein